MSGKKYVLFFFFISMDKQVPFLVISFLTPKRGKKSVDRE